MEHLFAERLVNALADLFAVQCLGVHGDEHAIHFQCGIDAGLHFFDGLHKQGHTAQGEEFGGHGNDHAISCGKRVHGEQAERWLAVDDDEIVFRLELAQHAVQDLLGPLR